MAHRTPHRKSKVRPFVLGFQHPWAGVRWGDWLNSHECPMMPHDVPCIFWPRWKNVSSLLVCTEEDISVNICHLSFNKPGSDFESPVAFWAVLYELGLPWERVLGHGPNRNASKTDSFYKSNICNGRGLLFFLNTQKLGRARASWFLSHHMRLVDSSWVVSVVPNDMVTSVRGMDWICGYIFMHIYIIYKHVDTVLI